MPQLTPAEIKSAQRRTKAWRLESAVIRRTYQFKDFPAAIAFVNQVAKLAEKTWHHPDIDVRWNKVTLTLTTHDEGGLTAKDFELAARFDTLAK